MPDPILDLMGEASDREQAERSEGRLRRLLRSEAGDLFGLDLEKREDREVLRDMVRWYRDEDRREAVSAVVRWWKAREAIRSELKSKGLVAAMTTLVIAAVTFLINRYGGRL